MQNRDYDAESERQQGVEDFYHINHINQTYDFVCNLSWNFIYFMSMSQFSLELKF